MKIFETILVVYLCTLASSVLATASQNKAGVASVNGKIISAETVGFLVNGQKKITKGSVINPDNNDQDENELKNKLLQGLIESEMIAQVAIDSGVQDLLEFKIKKRMQINNLLGQIYLTLFRENIIVNEQSIQKRYDELPAKYQYNSSRIKTAKIEAGQAALKALNSGMDFSTVANQYSIEANKKPGGKLGNMSEGQLPTKLWNSLLTLKEKGYTPELIKIRKYWYLLKLNSKTLIPKKSYQRMRARLENDIRQEQLISHVEAIRKNSTIVLPSSNEHDFQGEP